MEGTKCTICNSVVEQNYCSNCGQRIGRKRTTLISMLSDGIKSFLDVEKSALASILIIIKNPRKIVVNYIEGNRGYYPSPFKLLIYALAITALHLTYVDNLILGADINAEGVETHITFWLFFFPLLGLSSLISFARKNEPFIAHLISTLYISSAWFMLLIVIVDLFLFCGVDFIGGFVLLIFIELVFIWNSRVFLFDRKGISIVWGTLIQNVVIMALIGILVIVAYLLNSFKLQ